MEDKIIKVICDRYGCTKEDIIEANNFSELGIDSLSIYSLVCDIQEKFDIEIDMDDVWNIHEPNELIIYITEKLSDVKK